MIRWYVAQTHTRAERNAVEHLRRQGFRTYLPEYLKRRSHARRIDNVKMPLFPGYLFVAMDIATTRWRSVRSTIGVKALICDGDRPVPVPEGVVEDLRAREDETGLVRMAWRPAFTRGEAIEVTSGPLRDQIGVFDCAGDDERVYILLTLLGRQMRIPMPGHLLRATA
ncbi:MAG: transcription termination/antitermination protein NusG [Alphaproteobacteria bacterium]